MAVMVAWQHFPGLRVENRACAWHRAHPPHASRPYMSNTRSTTPPKGRATPARQSKPEPPSFKLMGAEYRLADKVGIWPLMQYARAIETGDNDMGQRRMMASAHAILEDSVHPDDWGRFQEDMISKKMDDLLVVLDAVMGAVRIADAKRSRNGRRTPVRAATAEITT